jgi:P27 family predicted phage terminase small subunit
MSKQPRRKKRTRVTKAQRQTEEANRLATLIASAPIEGDTSFAAPGFIRDHRLAPALAVWRELVPLLTGRRVLDDADRFQLAMLSYWWAEFIVAADDLLKRGYILVKTISGDRMPRKNASAGRRDHAFDKIAELSTKFGLTPLDRYALARAAKASGDVEDMLSPRARSPAPEVPDEPSEDTKEWQQLVRPETKELN